MSMPCRPKPHQLDIFAASDGGQVAQTPLWHALPTETRRVLTQLMVQLILDHGGRLGIPGRDEMRHDV
jgi:hypothetical protein